MKGTENKLGNGQGRELLVIDDEQNMRHMLNSLLTKTGFHVTTAANGEEALEMVSGTHFDYILCDIKMPKMNGLQFLDQAARWIGDSTVIMMSAYGSVDTALEAMKKGAYDYISKPFKSDEVNLVLKKAEERERLKRENTELRHTLRNIEARSRFGNMVTKSKAMQEIIRFAKKVAPFDTTVLITGESGTGKELVARGIHFTGPRARKPWVPVNCGGIPENLIESELFGHVKGAFTGADRSRRGLFREADGGTLFLDEIGELPLSLQVKLLRVLQENEVRPVGGGAVHKGERAGRRGYRAEPGSGDRKKTVPGRSLLSDQRDADRSPAAARQGSGYSAAGQAVHGAFQPGTWHRCPGHFTRSHVRSVGACLARQRPGARKCHPARRGPGRGTRAAAGAPAR